MKSTCDVDQTDALQCRVSDHQKRAVTSIASFSGVTLGNSHPTASSFSRRSENPTPCSLPELPTRRDIYSLFFACYYIVYLSVVESPRPALLLIPKLRALPENPLGECVQ